MNLISNYITEFNSYTTQRCLSPLQGTTADIKWR